MTAHFAHSVAGRDPQFWQRLPEHLGEVGRLAEARAKCFGLAQAGFVAGLYHDLGKYAPAFQRKLAGEVSRVDHSTGRGR